MSRRTILQRFMAAIAIIIVLFVSGPAFGQGNRDAAFERVKEVQERHTDALMARPGVVGTAVGLDDGNPAVVVLLERGAVANVPAVLEGIKVKKVVTGQIVARDDTERYPRAVPIGVSTGHPAITAGTLGCRVKDSAGNVYALSNNHVFANMNNASIDDPVIQPGTYDGGTSPADDIGTLADFEPIVFSWRARNTIDAAIASTTTALVGYATPSGGYGTPGTTTEEAYIGMAVQKRGRTTLLTTGTVDAINATVTVGYGAGKYARFVDQIVIVPGDFSAGGDSGSLIVTDDGNKNPVGLLFAGSSTHTIANPIDAVLSRFSVDIDDGSASAAPSDTPPNVSITNPMGGSTVAGSETITANATDDKGITQVAFFVDGSSIGMGTFASGVWSATWDTTAYGDGTHTLKAEATDTILQTASDSISVTVDNQQNSDSYVVTIKGVLQIDTRPAGKNIFVSAYATIHVALGGADASGALVTGDWSGDVSGQSSDYTDVNGDVTLYSPEIKTKKPVTFNLQVSSVDGYEVTDVSKSITYTPPTP